MESTVNVDLAQVDEIIEGWEKSPDFIIEMMQDIQKVYRHLPRPALERMAEATGADIARLHHVATFYKAFSLEPRGEVSIQVCTGTACHVSGAARVIDAFSRELDIEPGETTKDLAYTLEGVRCLGCCTLAPVVTMGDDLHSELDSSRVGKLLRRYKKKNASKEQSDV